MRDGWIQQVSTPLELYDYPVNRFVAGFIGNPAMNFLRMRLDADGKRLHGDFGTIDLPKGLLAADQGYRSEERRVGKERVHACRDRCSTCHSKKQKNHIHTTQTQSKL